MLVVQERVRRAGCQVEVLGFTHNASIVNNEVIGDGQRILMVATVDAAQHLLFSALKLLTDLLQRLVIDHVVAVRRVLGEQVLRQVLFEPLILSVGGGEITKSHSEYSIEPTNNLMFGSVRLF